MFLPNPQLVDASKGLAWVVENADIFKINGDDDQVTDIMFLYHYLETFCHRLK